MNKKSPVVLATEAATLHSEEVSNTDGKAKALYQYSTLYFIAILLICTLVSSITLIFSYQQSKQSQALISEQIAPLQIQFQQQSYLNNANNLIADILQNSDVSNLVSMQQKLSLQSKKLSLLQSQHKDLYQQWFHDNNTAIELVAGIESSHASNELLKGKGLIQLDTLLDAIEIQLNKPKIDSKTEQVLSIVKNKLSNIATRVQHLSLSTSIEEFDLLHEQIDEMFTADYGKVLAKQERGNRAFEEIVRDFIRFEDTVLKSGLLIKWQASLRLMESYQNQLMSDKKQLQNILVNSALDVEGQNSNGLIDINQMIDKYQLPLWIWVSFTLALVTLAILLWYIRLRIKISSQQTLDYICHALSDGSTRLKNEDRALITQDKDVSFYCAESKLLVEKIEQLNDSHFSESEYLLLVGKNQALEEKIVKAHTKQERLELALQQADINISDKLKLTTEQVHYEELHLVATKQLVLLACSAIDVSKHTKGNSELDTDANYLYQAYLQSRDLLVQLKQESCNRYLQSSDAILTLSDENFVAQMQAVLLNLANEFSASQNQVSLDIDENIQAAVNTDAELFTEMFRAFIKLLLLQQTQQKLLLTLQLVDKNNGQQVINFTGQVYGVENLDHLPQQLESFNQTNGEQKAPVGYFTTLLQYQHGENISAMIIEQGYKLCFTMPLAVTNTKQEQSYATMTFPEHFSTIDQAITKLTAKYLTMPIDVLLAVKCPDKYQRLQQLLQGMGLQVSFVSSKRMLESKWQSGRFAALITEISCAPFIKFKTSDQSTTQETSDLPRGVFLLDSELSLEIKEEFTHWAFGKLTADSAIDELVIAMKPWIKEQSSKALATNELTQVNKDKESKSKAGRVLNIGLASSAQVHSFDFERYIKNQGSPALALYMINEYTSENSAMVERLEKAFYGNDVTDIDIAVQALAVNAKILAADCLLHLCEYWQKLLSKQGIDNCQDIQINLLNKTKQAVDAVNLHADAVA